MNSFWLSRSRSPYECGRGSPRPRCPCLRCPPVESDKPSLHFPLIFHIAWGCRSFLYRQPSFMPSSLFWISLVIFLSLGILMLLLYSRCLNLYIFACKKVLFESLFSSKIEWLLLLYLQLLAGSLIPLLSKRSWLPAFLSVPTSWPMGQDVERMERI